jgi:RNA polymerase sigma factor (sigma-70 family)
MSDPPTVFIVDDDASVRSALQRLVASVGLRCETFASADEFLGRKDPDGPGCLVLDVRMPGPSGLDLQDQLARSAYRLPIIFLTAHGDVRMSVRAMKAGAVEFLTKPFREQELLDAIRHAIERDRLARRDYAELLRLRELYETLTPRERQVMSLVIAGLPNKQIASDLAISEKTVKVHRGEVMQKMQARSLAALVSIARQLETTAQA